MLMATMRFDKFTSSIYINSNLEKILGQVFSSSRRKEGLMGQQRPNVSSTTRMSMQIIFL